MRAVLCQTLKVGKTFRVSNLCFLALAALLLLALLGAAVVSAQEGGGYDLSWSTVDGGGSTPSTGGGYTLMSTVGQPDPGPALSGGGFTLNGGFWPAGIEAGGDEGGDIYLPLVLKGFNPGPGGPDLVIDRLAVTGNDVSLTIRNAGNQPVANPFWVDVYFNPSAPPQLNQPWPTLAEAGAVWGVTASLDPGQSLDLTSGDAYYVPAESSAGFPTGATVYGYVDSVNFDTTYGNVLESSETNNRTGPITAAAGGQLPGPGSAGMAGAADLPER